MYISARIKFQRLHPCFWGQATSMDYWEYCPMSGYVVNWWRVGSLLTPRPAKRLAMSCILSVRERWWLESHIVYARAIVNDPMALIRSLGDQVGCPDAFATCKVTVCSDEKIRKCHRYRDIICGIDSCRRWPSKHLVHWSDQGDRSSKAAITYDVIPSIVFQRGNATCFLGTSHDTSKRALSTSVTIPVTERTCW